MIHRMPHILATVGWLSWLTYGLMGIQPAIANTLIEPSAATQPHASTPLQVLDQRTGQGEQCLVCDKQIFDVEVVEVRHQGRVFHVAAGEMFRLFAEDPETYFRKLQARSALFDELAVRPKQISVAWLGFGLYVLLGLVSGAVCAYVAITKGLAPVSWFFAGIVGNGVVLAVLMNAQSRCDQNAPAGIPPGLAKVPTTYKPQPCHHCDGQNHPSATRCGSCGASITATVESEVVRAATGS